MGEATEVEVGMEGEIEREGQSEEARGVEEKGVGKREKRRKLEEREVELGGVRRKWMEGGGRGGKVEYIDYVTICMLVCT